jgi:fructokinase
LLIHTYKHAQHTTQSRRIVRTYVRTRSGTTFVVSIAEYDTATPETPPRVTRQYEIKTGKPAPTLQRAIELLRAGTKSDGKSSSKEEIKASSSAPAQRQLAAIGIGSFGPVDLNDGGKGTGQKQSSSKTYGFITSTPKPHWHMTDIVGPVRAAFPGVPVGFDTDVNAAALAEVVYGAHGADTSSCAYVTVGTGIGVGLVVNGAIVHGLLHPEMGHIRVARHPTLETLATGTCPFHGDCLEGLAASGALLQRIGKSSTETDALKALPDSHSAWQLEAYYIAQLCANLALTLSPHVIVLGGGITRRKCMWPRIRAQFRALLNNYLQVPQMTQPELLQRYIVPSRFDADDSNTSAGAMGSLHLAVLALQQKKAAQ